LAIAEALRKIESYLDDFEKNFYHPPRLLSWVAPALSRFSAYCYVDDVFKMKSMLLESAVQEHLQQVRITPTDLEVHASLASSYIALSKIYKPHFEEKHRTLARLAVEEFSILSHYAPNDPWVHEQLAFGYQALNMPQEEMREMELLLRLKSNDKDILYRLGNLYFKQGMNAKGLQVYEELKRTHLKKAEDLIGSYGSV
jgi:tetratricopeptide (TPR) repeat protein